MTLRNLALLRNHGQVVVGKSLDDAIQRAVFFELACTVLVLGRDRTVALPRGAVEQLRAMASSRGS